MSTKSRRLSPELLEYRDSAEPTRLIAARYCVSPSTLTVRARKAGLALRNRGRWKRTEPTTVQKKIIAMARTYGCRHTALRFGITKQRISFLMRRWKNWPDRLDGSRSTGAQVITFQISDSVMIQLDEVLKHPWFSHLDSTSDAAREIVKAFLSGNVASVKVNAQVSKST